MLHETSNLAFDNLEQWIRPANPYRSSNRARRKIVSRTTDIKIVINCYMELFIIEDTKLVSVSGCFAPRYFVILYQVYLVIVEFKRIRDSPGSPKQTGHCLKTGS